MSALTRQTDSQGRVTLFEDFASTTVIVERVGDDEIRIRKAKAAPKRPSLKEMLARVTDENRHGETDTGPAVGGEVW